MYLYINTHACKIGATYKLSAFATKKKVF